ncbi:class I SAM-dependent methyltransferase [soil metagenome]
MDKNKITATTWNKIAVLYQEKFMDLDLYNDSYAAFCEKLKAQASVLEVGCGPGNITRYLLANRPDLKILGTDLAPNMIELARKNNPTAEFRELDAKSLSSLTQVFDGIMAGFIVPYLSREECNQLLKNAYQLLNEDGLLYLSFTEGNYDDSGFLSASTGDQTYFYYHSPEEFKELLIVNQFTLVHSSKVLFKRLSGSEETHIILMAVKNGDGKLISV